MVAAERPVSLELAGKGGGSSALSTKSIERVMDSLGDVDKYNAVLQGLAGLVVSNKGKKGEGKEFGEVFGLLDEMHANKIKCSVRTASAVVDAAASTADVGIVSQAFTKLRRAGVSQKFSRDLGRLTLLPTEPKRRGKALNNLAPVPSDSRAQEVAYAGSFIGVVGVDFAGEGVGQVMHYDTTLYTVLSLLGAAALGWDLYVGSGVSKTIINGLNRLFLRDVERESRVEAGGFLAAYLTGLPCFAFQPNAIEAVRMAAHPELAETLSSGNGLHRVLVWLMAGVVGEGMVHRQMIASDPRQAYAFLELARERGLGGDMDAKDDDDRVAWAFNEARALIKANEPAYEALRRRLESGGATVGECMSLIERSLS